MNTVNLLAEDIERIIGALEHEAEIFERQAGRIRTIAGRPTRDHLLNHAAQNRALMKRLEETK